RDGLVCGSVGSNRMATGPVVAAVPTPETRAEQIMDVASRLFHERGYGSVSIRDIAAAAGVSSSTLYHHFVDKQQILFAITERFSIAFTDAMFAVAASDEDPVARLRSLVTAQIKFQVARRTDL